MMVNERWLGEVWTVYDLHLFIYATHFVVVRFLNKSGAAISGQPAGFDVYVCVMPLLAVTLCYQAARVAEVPSGHLEDRMGTLTKSRIYG